MDKKETKEKEKKKKFTRYSALIFVFSILITLVAARLANIQIVHGEEYRALALDKSIRSIEDEPQRGEILDRNGIKLATNDQDFVVFMMKPQDELEEENLIQVIERLVDILDKNNETIKDDFPIMLKYGTDGNFEYTFEFQNNYTDEAQKQEYNDRAAAAWKKANNIPEDYDAEKAFSYLKDKYKIAPEQEPHNNPAFMRKMMAVRQRIEDMGYKLYKPVEIAYVTRETAFEVMEKGLYLPGVDYKIKPVRKYPFEELAANIIGSLRKIPGSSASDYKDKHYDVNTDLVGRDGIEYYAEDDLRGEKGGRTVRVDKLGRIVEELGKRDPVPGNNIVLTIDKNLQQASEKALDDVISKLAKGELRTKQNDIMKNASRGAAVVIDVKNGEVLAMASRPGGYDPNLMAKTGGISTEDWEKLNPSDVGMDWVHSERLARPMYNYATMGAVPPGSVFKMVTAIAGLETRKITPWEYIYDKGLYDKHKFTGACWLWELTKKTVTHGNVNLKKAIQVSCNYYFFEVGDRIGLQNLCNYARLFGLSSEPTGIEIGEFPGGVADENIRSRFVNSVLKNIKASDTKESVEAFKPTGTQEAVIEAAICDSTINDIGEVEEILKNAGINNSKLINDILDARKEAEKACELPGTVLNAAIGQGDNRFTPLQIANYIATIANGGTRYRPHLVKQIVKPDGTVVKDVKAEVLQKIKLRSSTINAIRSGMNAVLDDGGTAHAAFNGFPVKVAGKTGTAQIAGMDDFSWFSGYAPVDNPQIAVAVVIHEGGGVGAAEAARDIFAQYFKDYIDEGKAVSGSN